MVVSSRAPAWVDNDEVLARGPFSEVSRIALEINAVSPLLKASTIRNFRTDCSREFPFSKDRFEADRAPAAEADCWDAALPKTLVPAVESLELCPLGEFE